MPITRSEVWSKTKWEAAVNFVANSEIETLIVVDKTKDASATEYFMESFNLPNRNLFILPRSISESHYESLGSIQLDENIWIMQLHDDDDWQGHVRLPEKIDPSAAYYSRFYIKNRTKEFMEENDFTYPARVNFVLTPAHIWNKFALIIQNQKYHVAGSMDSTLNLMVQLTCNLIPIPDCAYFYDNHNWASRIASRRSLLALTEKDGWSTWASIDIALLSRHLDNLSCLSYVAEFAEAEAINAAFESLMQRFKPRLRRETIIRLEILILKAMVNVRITSFLKDNAMTLNENLALKLSRASFIRNSWSIKQLTDVIELVRQLEKIENLTKLQNRFHFWHVALLNLSKSNRV